MSEWKEVIIEDIKANGPYALSTGPFGSAISSQFFVEKGIPVIRGSNLSADTSKRLIENDFAFITEEKAKEFARSKTKIGDLIFTCWGTINQIGLIEHNSKFSEYVISNKQMKLSPDPEKADSLFLYYLFSSPNYQNQIIGNNIGSSVPGFNLGQLRNMSLLLPTLSEQQSIVSILTSLDDKIDLLQRQNKTLEAMAETLFRQWFVEEAEESWEEMAISNIIDVRDGTHDSPKQVEDGFHLITSKHLKESGLDFLNAYKISESDFIYVNKRSRVEKNDILFSMIGTLGLIHFVDTEPNFAIKNIGLFKTSQNTSFSYFLYLLLKSTLGQQFIFESASGSTQEYITLSSLRAFKFKYPGENKIIEFHIFITPYFNKIFSNKNQLQSLIELRDTLLPKLMNAEINVKSTS
jgi:type I restriction enzyme S subunit